MKNLLVFSTICFLPVLLAAKPTSGPKNFSTGAPVLAGNPEAVFHDLQIEHNVREDGEKGMRIHANFNVNNIKNRGCYVYAYFYKKSGEKLPDKNLKYRSYTGDVCTPAKALRPDYDMTWYKDLKVFMPYEELHVNGKHQLKFRLGVYYNDRYIGFSEYENFEITWNPAVIIPDGCIDINKNAVADKLQSELSGLRITLDETATIKLGGKTLSSCPLGGFTIRKPGYDWYYNIQNINSQTVSVSTSGDKFVLKLRFEGDGSEIKGKAKKGAKFLRDKRVPDINWVGDKSIELMFNLVGNNGSVKMRNMSSKMNGRFEINGHWDDTLEVFYDFEAQIKRAVEKGLNGLLIRESLVRPLENSINTSIRNTGVRNYKSIKVVGSSVRFCM